MIFSNSLSQFVFNCQERPKVPFSSNNASPVQNQSLVLLVVTCVSKVKPTQRVFFARKLFNRPKYHEIKVEKSYMSFAH